MKDSNDELEETFSLGYMYKHPPMPQQSHRHLWSFHAVSFVSTLQELPGG